MASSVEMDLGRRIQQARKAAGFKNAEQLAVHLDVGYSTVQRWEHGKTTPTIRRLRAIADATGFPLAFFLVSDEHDEAVA